MKPEPEFDPPNYRDDDEPADDRPESTDEKLLEKVLLESLDESSQAAIRLIFSVAQGSEYSDTTDIRAVEEVVQAIVNRRFGPGRIGKPLMRRVAVLLGETPEACIRLERIWQEARRGG